MMLHGPGRAECLCPPVFVIVVAPSGLVTRAQNQFARVYHRGRPTLQAVRRVLLTTGGQRSIGSPSLGRQRRGGVTPRRSRRTSRTSFRTALYRMHLYTIGSVIFVNPFLSLSSIRLSDVFPTEQASGPGRRAFRNRALLPHPEEGPARPFLWLSLHRTGTPGGRMRRAFRTAFFGYQDALSSGGSRST